MALLFKTSKNHLRYNTRALCFVFWNRNVSIATPNYASQFHILAASVGSSNEFASLRKHSDSISLSYKPPRLRNFHTLYRTPAISCRQFSSGTSIPAGLWKLGRLNHIAIAVPDLDKATAFYRDVLQATVSAPQPLPEHGVTTVFVELDNTKIELLLPLGDKSPIQKFLDKNKSGGLHHVCLEVDDIEAAVAAVKGAGVRCLSPTTRIGAHGKPVMFLHPADCGGVLLELEQA